MSTQVVNIVPDDLANAVLPTAMKIGVWQLYLLCKLVAKIAIYFSTFKFL